ncbi:tRNA adenosine(34) deaminase TadA [Ruminococcus sp. FC2018]|uniref:tRNA adenosine(34) deaminase TadA n=1 Tax=Ruminococcus sp. FC2018 TaxID=1410617 RepID=UPI00048CB464|nr:tRNA adenosine(34) deaminase TadA [Ruminococcus sp. FC2018]
MDRDEIYMRKALELAELAARQGEVPVGAIVVKRSTGEIVGRGFNRREYGRSPLTHAEIVAIETASRKLGGWRLIDCELYVTLEPCPMCAGAIINSRIQRVVFGASDPKAGSCGSVVNLFELPYNHKPQLVGGVLKEECADILSRFFRQLRENKKQT